MSLCSPAKETKLKCQRKMSSYLASQPVVCEQEMGRKEEAEMERWKDRKAI